MAAVRTRRTVQEIEKIAIECIQRLGYENLLPEQKTAIINFVCGHDVFVCLPTGFGKSLIYFSLPLIYDTLYSRNKSSIIIVVSPLNALMDDQVRFLVVREFLQLPWEVVRITVIMILFVKV